MKYKFTPAMDEIIRKAYREDFRTRGYTKKLAIIFSMPKWRVIKRARQIEAYEPKIKEPVWSEKELRILNKHAWKTPENIRLHLLKAGFKRSITGIFLKRKRMRFLNDHDFYTACQAAMGFGVDVKTVTRWIEQGLLKAVKRGTKRTSKQGGDMWWIHERDIRQFIIENVGIIDFRKVEKFWIVDILVNGGAT